LARRWSATSIVESSRRAERFAKYRAAMRDPCALRLENLTENASGGRRINGNLRGHVINGTINYPERCGRQ
jgi:hypothetical protein